MRCPGPGARTGRLVRTRQASSPADGPSKPTGKAPSKATEEHPDQSDQQPSEASPPENPSANAAARNTPGIATAGISHHRYNNFPGFIN